jgi:hypothetical protein
MFMGTKHDFYNQTVQFVKQVLIDARAVDSLRLISLLLYGISLWGPEMTRQNFSAALV